jgi:uncharacterized integral membrane protein
MRGLVLLARTARHPVVLRLLVQRLLLPLRLVLVGSFLRGQLRLA